MSRHWPVWEATRHDDVQRRQGCGGQPDPFPCGGIAARGVRVNAVAPSLITTDATADIPPADVAESVRRIPWVGPVNQLRSRT